MRETEPQRPEHNADLPAVPRDPIEPDPMNSAQAPPADPEPNPAERPDLEWAEHED